VAYDNDNYVAELLFLSCQEAYGVWRRQDPGLWLPSRDLLAHRGPNNGILPGMAVHAVVRKYDGGKPTVVWTNIGEKAHMMATRMLTRESCTKIGVHIKRAGGA
jgi:hypothetical protein